MYRLPQRKFFNVNNLKRAVFDKEIPNLTKLGPSNCLNFKSGFRRIYVTVIKKWLGANSEYLLICSFTNWTLYKALKTSLKKKSSPVL